jgi:hypothetical protein
MLERHSKIQLSSQQTRKLSMDSRTIADHKSSGQMLPEGLTRSKSNSRLNRAQLHLKPEQFLAVQRDEALEQKLGLATGTPEPLLYRVSQAGDEIKERTVVHHIFTDVDPSYVVAVGAGGSTYRLSGFAESKADFNKLMGDLKVRISSPDQAEALADFYREVNPERLQFAPATSLLDLKQAAERQCQDVPFNVDEPSFEVWWKHAKTLYSGASFKQTVIHSDSGYAVEWIVLSSPGAGLCGGAALRVRLDIGTDGRVGSVAFGPLGAAVPRRNAPV